MRQEKDLVGVHEVPDGRTAGTQCHGTRHRL